MLRSAQKRLQLLPKGSMSAVPLWFALPRQQKTQSKHVSIALLVRRAMTDKGKTKTDGHSGVGSKSGSV